MIDAAKNKRDCGRLINSRGADRRQAADNKKRRVYGKKGISLRGGGHIIQDYG